MTHPLFAAAAIGAALVGLAAPASAQTLSQEGRAETRANTLNESLSNQSVNRGAAQQNQFEVNSLRNQPPPPQAQTPPGALLPRR